MVFGICPWEKSLTNDFKHRIEPKQQRIHDVACVADALNLLYTSAWAGCNTGYHDVAPLK